MNVLIAGIGNIGTTLANAILAHREILGVSRVRVCRSTPQPWTECDLNLLEERGAEITIGSVTEERVWNGMDYVFDCRKEKAPLAAFASYAANLGLKGVVAQGSETGFGIPFVAGVNSGAISGQKFVQVVSCNTHANSTILRALAGPMLQDLVEADLVTVRRSEDIGSHERLVAASVVARHRSGGYGTHHAEDTGRVFESLGVHPRIMSSDITTPSQLMHSARFSVRLKNASLVDAAIERMGNDPYLATTTKFDSNRIFELGRRYGFQGRIFAHAIIVINDLVIQDDTIRGWAFVPQEGNTILSTLEAFLLQTRAPYAAAASEALRARLITRRW